MTVLTTILGNKILPKKKFFYALVDKYAVIIQYTIIINNNNILVQKIKNSVNFDIHITKENKISEIDFFQCFVVRRDIDRAEEFY